MVVLLTAGICLSINFNYKGRETVFAAELSNNPEFSAVDSNNIVLAVEKVNVISTNDEIEDDSPFTTPLYDAQSLDTVYNSMLTRDGAYYFDDISNDGQDRYIVHNGDFVMLNNDITSSGYTNSQTGFVYDEDSQTYEPVSLAEAVMVSFGQYVFVNGTTSAEYAGENTGANIQYINVQASRNGVPITNLPGVRQYDNNLYQDFVYIIPQVDGNEGYYEFNITYRYNNVTYFQTFNFYILYESSYDGMISHNGFQYNAQPTIECEGVSLTTDASNVLQYNLGQTSANYPTLTYDYTKYKMSYTLTANGRVTTYDYDYTTNTTIGGTTANLVCTITSSSGTRYETYNLGEYDINATNNIVVLLLTEVGSYNFSFEYVYSGYNADNMPDMNLTIANQALNIHGFELKYSKANYQEAQMKYLLLSKDAGAGVDLVVPNGYLFGAEPSIDSLGLSYDLKTEFSNTETPTKVGTVWSYQDATINHKINDINSSFDADAFADNVQNYDTLLDDPTANADAINSVAEILGEITYEKTNQGSLWLSSNDTFSLNRSFYFYSTSAISPTSLYTTSNDEIISTSINYTNQVSFNRTGYYLVFIYVTPTNAEGYYQIFAFRYTTDTININVNTEDGEVVGSGRYTNKNVIITWAQPDVFEREITARYYYIVNQGYTKDQLLNLNYTALTSGDLIGQNIQNGQFAVYLIELISEGSAATYRMFTIDRQPISGVMPYAVEAVSNVDNSTSYEFKTTSSGEYIRVTSSIIDSYVTLYWNDKASGANITATYTYTPFVRNNNLSASEVYLSDSAIWYTTNYELGTTIGSFDISRVDSIGSQVQISNILFNQGIYVFTLTDEAGFTCKYMFVIDNTEAYFKVEGEMVTGASLLYGDDIEFEVGTHKVFKLMDSNATSDEKTNELYSLIKGEYQDNDYFLESGTNTAALGRIFTYLPNDNSYYLTVQNNSLTAYSNLGILDDSLSIQNITASNHTRTMQYVASASTSMIRVLYLMSENQTITDSQDSNSFVTLTINKDNSRGTVYYSQDAINVDNDTVSSGTILDTGSDNTVGDITYNGIDGAMATSDNYVAFVWNMGTGTYEVGSITYRFYELNLSEDNYTDDWNTDRTNLKYYSFVNEITLYSNGAFSNGAQSFNSGTQGFALINVVDGMTRAGLYVIERTYVGDESTDFGEDSWVQNYYFIVDRNDIIDRNNDINGGFITINLLEDETEFNEFSQINTDNSTFSYIQDNISNQRYDLYLRTDKLPATLNIPIGKYFGGRYGSNYYAGRLVFDVYFVDRQNQLSGSSRGTTIKLFSIDTTDSADTSNYDGNYYNIDMTQYLSNPLQEIFIRGNNEVDWLCLPGDYVVIIKDLVVGTTGSHSKIIGFRIETSNPTTDVYSVPESDLGVDSAYYVANEANNDGTYVLTTSEEFVKINLNEYNVDSTTAQVDINYLIVTRTQNGRTTDYIRYEYSNTGGEFDLNTDSSAVQNIRDDSGNVVSRVIYLNTYLRDSSGNINYDSINDTLYYDIVIRYKLSGNNVSNRYIDCYYYYDANGNLVTYYETRYRVIIDRIPPENNIDYLVENDTLVEYYNLENETEMFSNYIYETNAGIYFVNRYDAYYTTSNAGKIYAFVVNANTPFDNTDVDRVYFRAINDLSEVNLSLPITNFAGYTAANSLALVSTYGGILTYSEQGRYVEILEIDSAGNMTQYVVLYADQEYDNLTMTLNLTTVNSGVISASNRVFDLSTDTMNDSLTIFDLALPSVDVFNSVVDKFYRFELTNLASGETVAINTNGTDDFVGTELAQKIIDMVKNAGRGNYIFTIRSRTNTYSGTLNYYDADDRIELNVANLVEFRDGQYVINLQGANETYNNIVYYAEQIQIIHNNESTTYRCIPSDNEYNYYIVNGSNLEPVASHILTNLSGTYQIIMTDAFGTVSTYRFNTSGEEFYSLSFGEDGTANYYETNNTYYTFNQANISYDTSLYELNITYNINGENLTVSVDQNVVTYNGITIIEIDRENGNIVVYPFIGSNYAGAILQVRVQFIYNNEYEFGYNIVLDSTTGTVTLRDTNNVSQNMNIDINTNYEDTIYTSTTSGTMNLSWTVPSNDYFRYYYSIHELMQDGEYVTTQLDNQTNYVINTSQDSTGTYKFEIEIYTIEGLYLGNKVYTFSVQSMINQLYYVQTGNNVAVSSNSTFRFQELFADTNLAVFNITANSVAGSLKLTEEATAPDLNSVNANIPLYISNEELFVIVAADQGATMTKFEAEIGTTGYVFKIYRIATTTYSLYLGILQVPNLETIVQNIKLNTDNLSTNNNLSFVYSDASTSEYVLSFGQVLALNNYVIRKNSIVLEVYYNDVLVSTIDEQNNGANVEYEIEGNGKYSFVFKDLAGNSHVFTTTYGTTQTNLDIIVLREVAVTVNGTAPIDYAYYNGEVEISVYSPSIYDLGSIDLVATRNGQSYSPIKSQYNYTFTDYGTYRVTVTANYNGLSLRKVLIFTIVNENEARVSIDFTSLSNYKISSVINGYGRDVTDTFLNMLNMNSSVNGMLLTYDKLMENSAELGIASGKQTFTMTYVVDDGIYPRREITFLFTMNNETPNIECSLPTGETTTDGFTITFNPGIIYDQVGDSYLYINDILVTEINENSAVEQMQYTITESENGAGDYYIRLESSSGNVILSFKSVIKEPLNVWAIIIIVVVVAVVITVVTVIIVLRTRMRIR